MSFQRARQPAQKAERRAAILAAAGALFDQQPYDSVALKDVAKAAGVGKASLYTYFRTKEEIFLSVYQDDIAGWLDATEAALAQAEPEAPAAIAALLADEVLARPRACRLGVLLGHVLERNVPDGVLLDFKRGVLLQAMRFVAALARVLPGVQPDALMGFAIDHFALVGGLWPMGNPAPEVRRVLDGAPELRPLDVQMRPALERALRVMLTGLLAERDATAP